MGAILAGALLLVACGSAGAATPQAAIRVVLIDAFTGPSAVRGASLQNSLQLEIEALNGGGGLLGRRVELVAADDEMKPAKAADLAREYLADERVGLLVGPSGTTTFAAARGSVDQARVPDCLPVRVSDDAVAGAPATFRTRAADRTTATVLLDYLQRRTPVRRLGAITASDGDAQYVDQLLGGMASRMGVEYAGSVSLAAAQDPHAAVQQLASRAVQGLLLPGDAVAAGQVSRALQDLGLKDQVRSFGFDELTALAYPDDARDAAVGSIVVAPIAAALTDVPSAQWPAAYRAFVKTIGARYGYTANGVEIRGLPAAAECVSLWAAAVRRAGGFDGPRVARAWEGLQIDPDQSTLGVAERFTPRQHDALASDGLFVYQWIRLGTQYRLKQLAP
ncbi:MAG TPA: ABC transporter substrate-binding protein [Candidatus Dormibacteraeota bacterium]|nr:ABC transporter substrate-binding protein [Candidatus Dormibacteraeota bacterium]